MKDAGQRVGMRARAGAKAEGCGIATRSLQGAWRRLAGSQTKLLPRHTALMERWAGLPRPLLEDVLAQAGPVAKAAASTVCRAWRDVAQDEHLWRSTHKLNWGALK